MEIYMKYKKLLNASLITILSMSSIFGMAGVPAAFADTKLQAPAVTAIYTNLQTKLKWKKVNGADAYQIYRASSASGKYKKIGTVSATEKKSYSYTDHYYKSLKSGDGSDLLVSGAYVDPTKNSLRYRVRAVKLKTVSGKQKVTQSAVQKDGVFHLEAPDITKVKTAVSGNTVTDKVTFGTVPNAEGYIISSGNETDSGSISWTEVKSVSAGKKTTQTASVNVDADADYITVKAYAKANGQTVYSDFDQTFTTSDRNYQGENVLYLGDSISYGTPYESSGEEHIFSYPRRVAQITGCRFYNPAMSGMTIAYSKKDFEGKYNRYSLYKHQALPISKGKSPKMPSYAHNKKKKSSFADYDVVVIQAGTNDYQCNIRLGSASGTDTTTFSGALNQTMKLIEEGSKARIEQGKAPIKVVVTDLFYSERYGSEHYKRINRFKQKNGIGLTLTAYQKAINKVVKRYSRKNDLTVYQFSTGDYLNASNIAHRSPDNLHLTRYAYGQYGTGLAEYLIENVFDD